MNSSQKKKKKYIYLILPGLLAGLSGCGSTNISEYGAVRASKPLTMYELPEITDEHKTGSVQAWTPSEYLFGEEAQGWQISDGDSSDDGSEQAQAMSDDADAWAEAEDPLYDAVQAILQIGDDELFQGYPIDDSFLLWFRAKYGEAAFDALAKIEDITLDEEVWYEASGNTLHALWLQYCRELGLHAADLERVTFQDCASEDEIVMSFTGDMNFDDRMGTMQRLKQNGLANVLDEGVRQVMSESDILMINNECAYTTGGAPLEGKAFTFRSNPENVSILHELGVDIAGIANNHVCDYGLQGVTDTIQTLEDAGMPYVGAGNNITEAKKPWYFVANGRKIGIVAATQIERTYNYTKEATEDTPGVLKTLQPEKYIEAIQTAKQNCDIVIAFVHWGTEGSNHYEEDQIDLAEMFAEAGADAIIGGHTHCLQGTSYVGEVPIIYSLGNFWFGSTETDGMKKKDTAIAQLVIDRNNDISFRFVPCVQENQQTTLAQGYEKERIIDYEQSISDGVWIDEDGNVLKNY